MLRRAIHLGINHIDTAQFYGPNVANELIHEALHPYPANLALVSKVGGRRDDQGAWLPAHEPDALREDIETNLRSLEVDRLAAVNLRVMDPESEDPSKPATVNRELFDRQLTAMIQARDDGLIAGIGLSNVSLGHLQLALDRTEIVCVQNAYNLVDRISQPVLDACIEHGIAFVPFFPLGSGFTPDNPVLGHPAVQREAAKLGRTPAQIALAWTLSVASTSTQSSVRCTAFCQPWYPEARWSSLHAGVQRLSSCQLTRRSSGFSQNPTARPAAYPAPSAVVSATTGLTTSTPSTSAWICMHRSLAVIPPSTLSTSRCTPESASIASTTSRLW